MKKKNSNKWWIVGILSFVFVIFSLFYPLPYYMEMPGGAYDIREVLKVDDKEDLEKGSYNFVAVTVSEATLAQIIYAWLTPYTEISPQEDVSGGLSGDDFWRVSQFYMETSQNNAIYEALSLAGEKPELTYMGVYVLSVMKNSTFKDVLNLADTVVAINDKRFKSSKELIDYVSSFKIGDPVTVTYISDKKEHKADGKIIKLSNGKNGIGIGLVDKTVVDTPVPIEFFTDGVGGPSAGLMFTLDIYDQLVDEDLRKGRVIAGTGTIEPGGTVGDIGGAGLKVVSAHEIGADIFFVPNNPVTKEQLKLDPDAKSNYDEAKAMAEELGTDMTIVPVTSLEEAIAYLKKTA